MAEPLPATQESVNLLDRQITLTLQQIDEGTSPTHILLILYNDTTLP